jgi:septal ring factor EnvC (AmiA/AmiB activator)
MPLRTVAPLLLLLTVLAPLVIGAQNAGDAQRNDDAARVSDRIRALQGEAERLAGESRTLVGDLRQREIDRQIKADQLKQAEAAMAEAEGALQGTTTRLANLELQRINQLPDMKVQLVDIYKSGRSGYARLLFSARDFRELARATRAVGALTAINERRIEEHRRTIEATRQERKTFEQRAKELQAKAADARRAKSASDSAVASAAELIRQIDSRRDLTAQYVGELQVAYTRLQQQVTTLSTDKPSPDPVAVPLRPFQGALEWPVQGRLAGAFGQPSSRLGGAIRNGVEIAAEEDAPVRAIHGGTVGYAGPFTGFGTLVIVDHGSNGYSLYGYLASTALEQGTAVEAGAEVGRVGLAPAGPPTLYFEMRIDGRSVNPVQWLKPR